jgi:hypothetical protein
MSAEEIRGEAGSNIQSVTGAGEHISGTSRSLRLEAHKSIS